MIENRISFISYMGGKAAISKIIVPLFPPHRRYVEVFMGSAAVFFRKPKAPVSILNDCNKYLVTLFEVVRDHPKELADYIKLVPIARDTYDEWTNLMRTDKLSLEGKIKQAVAYLYVHGLSYNNKVGQGFAVTGSRVRQFSDEWRETLTIFSEKLQDTAIENMDFAQLIKRYDNDETFMYLDPPYYVADKTRYYEYVFTQRDHIRLFQVLDTTKCKWLLSYDDCPYIRTLYQNYNIQVLKDHPNPSASKFVDGDRFKDELLITNYNLPRSQITLFDGDLL